MIAAVVVGGLWALLAAQIASANTLERRLPEPPPSTPRAPRPRRPRRPSFGLRIGLAAIAGLMLLAVQPELAPLPVLATIATARMAERRRARQHEADVIDQLPDVVDLLRLTTLAGLPVSGAIAAIGDRQGGPIGRGLARSATLLARGASTTDALAALDASCGRHARGLLDALADHDRYGTPLGPALDRVGVECRIRRRRQAEEDARRLPVSLLFPLVLTTLPAFALLTIVPLLMGSFSSLQL